MEVGRLVHVIVANGSAAVLCMGRLRRVGRVERGGFNGAGAGTGAVGRGGTDGDGGGRLLDGEGGLLVLLTDGRVDKGVELGAGGGLLRGLGVVWGLVGGRGAQGKVLCGLVARPPGGLVGGEGRHEGGKREGACLWRGRRMAGRGG